MNCRTNEIVLLLLKIQFIKTFSSIIICRISVYFSCFIFWVINFSNFVFYLCQTVAKRNWTCISASQFIFLVYWRKWQNLRSVNLWLFKDKQVILHSFRSVNILQTPNKYFIPPRVSWRFNFRTVFLEKREFLI